MKLSRLCLFLLVGAYPLVGQTSPAATPRTNATVDGLVTKDPGSEPIKKVLIELIAESQSDAGNYTATSGADGSFHITNIAPGRYRLFVERTGYLEVDKNHPRTEGRVLNLSAGQELKDLLIRLQPSAVVTGRVTDEDGDPMPNAQVAVARQTFGAGRARWEQLGAERTNDLGEYRIPNLAAGSYYISVSPPPDFKNLLNGRESHAEAADKSPATAYTTTFYPGVKDRGQATPVALRAGEEFPANFSLTPSPSLVVRGSVVNVPAGSTAVVFLQSRDFGTMVSGADVHKDGTFEIRDVSPGAYRITASLVDAATPMSARQSLQITSENVDSLRLSPQSGAWIHGRLRLEGKGNFSKIDPGQFFISLRSADDDDDVAGGVSMGDGFSNLAHVAADGSFEWKSVPSGRYYVQFEGQSGGSGLVGQGMEWYLKSVTAGGQDATETSFSVNGGAAVVDMVASANGASADGVVTNAKGEAVANAVIVAVPAARLRHRMDQYRKTTSDQSGRFTLHGLPPGDYTVFAWESMDGDAYYDPQFLKNGEEKSKALRLQEGDRKTLQLEAVPASDDPQ